MISLIPAYHRQYGSAEEAEKDWIDGKDFKIYGGPYTSVRDQKLLLSEWLVINIYWNWPHSDKHISIGEDNDN